MQVCHQSGSPILVSQQCIFQHFSNRFQCQKIWVPVWIRNIGSWFRVFFKKYNWSVSVVLKSSTHLVGFSSIELCVFCVKTSYISQFVLSKVFPNVCDECFSFSLFLSFCVLIHRSFFLFFRTQNFPFLRRRILWAPIHTKPRFCGDGLCDDVNTSFGRY